MSITYFQTIQKKFLYVGGKTEKENKTITRWFSKEKNMTELFCLS